MSGTNNLLNKRFGARFVPVTLAIGIAWLLMAVSAMAAPLQKSSYQYRADLAAGSPALDVYSSAENRDAPVMIFVHGGGWSIGKRSAVNSKPAHFIEQGFVFVSLDYRLFPTVNVDQQLGDIDAALGWISKNIAEFGGDAGNLHLMGHSAGSHLVSMTAVDPKPVASRLINNGALRSVIANDTRAYDLARIAAEARGGRMPRLYANVFGKDPNVWREFSPIYQVQTSRQVPNFLILYSGQGRGNTRQAVSQDFATALRRAGSQVSVFDGRKYSHLEINRGVGKFRDITAAIDTFLRENS